MPLAHLEMANKLYGCSIRLLFVQASKRKVELFDRHMPGSVRTS